MFQRIRVYMKDKHFIEGTLIYTDKFDNIVLNDSERFMHKKSFLKSPRTYLGLVIIIKKNIKYIQYIYAYK